MAISHWGKGHIMANRSANRFTLVDGVKGTVDVAGLAGAAVIDIAVDGERVNTPSLVDTPNGFEVSGVLEQVPDSHTVRLTLLLPHVNVAGKAVRFTGVGIVTTARTTIGGESLVDGVVHHYEVRSVSGTAEAVLS
jgi:hypothetical protein